MKETTFVIKELGFGWYWQDIANEDDAHIYMCRKTEVPQSGSKRSTVLTML